MPNVTLLDPVAQFDGSDRVLQHIKASLTGPEYDHLRFAVAYAKSGGVARIHNDLRTWKGLKSSRTAKLVVGIDQKGTSYQALNLALAIFDEVYVTHVGGAATFHPKAYMFWGTHGGLAILGSHNLTSGGLETNFEAAIKLTYELPAEELSFREFPDCWDRLIACAYTKRLDIPLLNQLQLAGSLMDETAVGAKKPWSGSKATSPGGAPIFPRVNPAPPSPLPKGLLTKPIVAQPAATKATAKKGASAPAVTTKTLSTTVAAVASTALVIQIKPHHNGEVFLSMTAVGQNPTFFGYPFTGWTTTKAGTRGYPQRLPDPVVEIRVYDGTGALVVHEPAYGLNTVYYDVKKEIRVTMSPHLTNNIAQYSILHMQLGSGGTDYLMEIHNPGTPQYAALLAVCDQAMPSGGKTPRRFGWI